MNTLVFGVRGKGKSVLAFHLAEKTGRSIAIYDVSHRFNRWPEFIARDPWDLEELIKHFPVVVYQPQVSGFKEFGEFSEIIWGESNEGCRDVTMLFDEASELQTAQSRHDWLHKWVRMAPVDSCDVIQTLHRPADAWATCRALAHHWFIFETWRVEDLEAIEKQCGPEVALAVTKLRGHQFIHVEPEARKMTAGELQKGSFTEIDRGESHGSLPNLRSGAARQVAVQ
ncbi:MAG: hypothetical protein ABSA41_12595 [Terriglobia bacterium]|jgi:hypothetical protein